jgi:hypothetical protein
MIVRKKQNRPPIETQEKIKTPDIHQNPNKNRPNKKAKTISDNPIPKEQVTLPPIKTLRSIC